jgi:hypothetical protein
VHALLWAKLAAGRTIDDATPTSAMQPPSAAEMVAPRLYSMPMAAAVSRNVLMSRSGSSEMNSCGKQRGQLTDDDDDESDAR